MIGIGDLRERDVPELVGMWRESFEHGVGVADPHPSEDQRHRLAAARTRAHGDLDDIRYEWTGKPA